MNLNLSISSSLTFCDAPENWQIGVQDPATPSMEGMLFFHHQLMFFLVMIGTFVFWLLIQVLINYNAESNKKSFKFTHSSELEIIWTITPAVLLIFIAVPSFSLLYATEEIDLPTLTVKVIGHQWYWSYEFSDFAVEKGSVMFDSYMVQTKDLEKGTFRLLEVDHRLVLPIKTHIRLLVTSADVIHSWAVPSLGVKIDATPGRISQGALYIKRKGLYFGQCSEICGVGHAFMPIVVKALDVNNFVKWLFNRIENN